MSMAHNILVRLPSPNRLAPLLAACLFLILPSGKSLAQLLGLGDAAGVQGKVECFTTATNGAVDGVVLDDGTSIHWPGQLETRFAGILKKGDRLRATGRTEAGPAGDTHFEVQTLTNLSTGASTVNLDFGTGPTRLPLPVPVHQPVLVNQVNSEITTVRGTVQRFTTVPRGDVDGAVLDNGTQLHWPPYWQARFTDNLKLGDPVKAMGRVETDPAGDRYFQVQSLTNLRIKAQAFNPDFATEPFVLPMASSYTPSRPVDREQRLRQLEIQIEQMHREIQRLRQEK